MATQAEQVGVIWALIFVLELENMAAGARDYQLDVPTEEADPGQQEGNPQGNHHRPGQKSC